MSICNRLPVLTSALAMTSLIASSLVSEKASATDDFTMLVMDAFAITGQGTVMTGQIKSGSIYVGDTVCIPLTNGETVGRPVTGIEMFRKQVESAEAGQLVGVLVEVDRKLVSRETVLHSDCTLADNGENEQNEYDEQR